MKLFTRVALVIALVSLSTPAHAQQIAGTFDQLRVLVKPGDTLSIVDQAGMRFEGKVLRLSDHFLAIDSDGQTRDFQPLDIDSIEKRGPDSLKNGALAGFATGGVFWALVLASAGIDDIGLGAATAAGLIYAGLGAGIGVGIDAMVEGRRVIYARSTPNGVSPILGHRRVGIRLTLSR